MSDDDGVVYRPYRVGDEQAINDGFNAAFRLERSKAEWAWKFPPDPDGRLIMLAERDGELLAHYSGARVRFTIDDREWNAAQIVDVFSSRAARRKFSRRGVWVETVDRFFDHFGRSGRVPLLFGFPSPRPLRLGVLQLGYDAMEPQPIRYLARGRPASMAGPRRLLYRAEPARDWEPRIDELWSRARCDYPVAAVRSAERALRRFAGHPLVRYHRFLVFPRVSAKAVAYVVFRSDEGCCRWLDLLWDHRHPGALDLVAHLSAQLAMQTGADREELWLNGDDAGLERLLRLGFETLPEPNKLMMVARAFDPEVDLRAMEGRVYVTMSDADLV